MISSVAAAGGGAASSVAMPVGERLNASSSSTAANVPLREHGRASVAVLLDEMCSCTAELLLSVRGLNLRSIAPAAPLVQGAIKPRTPEDCSTVTRGVTQACNSGFREAWG